MANIKDVCRVAGVSKATVSRVINGSENVSEKTRQAVHAAMESLGYRPNAYARALATRSYNTFGLILPDFRSHYFSSVLTQASRQVQDAGKKLLVSHSGEGFAGEREAVRALHAQHCDLVIIYSRHLSEEQLVEIRKEIGVPLLVLNRRLSDRRLYSFSFDQQQIARCAIDHLLAQGHRQIACITTPLSSDTGEQRLQAYKAALTEHGIEVDARYVAEGKSDMQSGYSAVMQLLDSGTMFTALFACNDAMAIGALRALADRQIKVPSQVAVTGIDADPAAEFSIPRLSTVVLPIIELTKLAIDTALLLAKQEAVAIQHHCLDGSLKAAESSATRS
jgi:DNA-binding LacI/PurR family transcriptional regulator